MRYQVNRRNTSWRLQRRQLRSPRKSGNSCSKPRCTSLRYKSGTRLARNPAFDCCIRWTVQGLCSLGRECTCEIRSTCCCQRYLKKDVSQSCQSAVGKVFWKRRCIYVDFFIFVVVKVSSRYIARYENKATSDKTF